jgi:hypothetical protein
MDTLPIEVSPVGGASDSVSAPPQARVKRQAQVKTIAFFMVGPGEGLKAALIVG